MSLQVDDDIDQHRRIWAFERAGWIVLLLLLVAAALGLFGPGILGSAHPTAPNGALSVEHLRFARARSPQRLQVALEPDDRGDGRFELWLDSAWLDAVTLEHITPQPDRVRAGAERTTLEFAWDRAPGRVPIVLEIEAQQFGRLRARIGSGAEAVEVSQFVHP
jgi:hypothetical protein